MEYLRKVIRRKLNLMMVFMRQHAREGEGDNGFMPGSQLEQEGKAFVATGEGMNWFMDPVSPPVYNLVSKDEVAMYSQKGTGMRPARVTEQRVNLAPTATRFDVSTT